MPAELAVKIKMYNVGELGDCFLLQFHDGTNYSNVLIDCGSFRNSVKSITRMNEIAEDIAQQVSQKGGTLQTVIGTHQHNDHLSGFVHAKAKFDEINIGQVWLSWLDDPNDQQAARVGQEYNNYLTNLRHISLKLAKAFDFRENKTAKEIKRSVDDILGFFGVDETNNYLNAKEKFPPDLPTRAIQILRKYGAEKPRYLSPGEVFNLPGLTNDTVKVYVLGPPKNEIQLKDSNPNSKETYDHGLAVTNAQAEKFLLALNTRIGGETFDSDDQPYPLDERDTDSADFQSIWYSYFDDPKNKWRQIDNDWLKQAERLALWLDSYTNNSSLVLAFELVKSNKVLLFVGDAQTGNWNSWRTIKWKNASPGFDWKSLLQKTVLYKVGHHCSHNATLVEGLEAMQHEELVAMIPVDESDSNIVKKGWKMPAKNLYARLKEKTKGRILKMDEGIVDKAKKEVKQAWDNLGGKVKVTDLFIEYEIKG